MCNWNIALRLAGIFTLSFGAGFMCMTAQRTGPAAANWRQQDPLAQPRAERQTPAKRIKKNTRRAPDRTRPVRPAIRLA